MRPGLLGPFRVWKYPKHFRSNKVKKAIAIRGQIMEEMIEMSMWGVINKGR